VIGDRVVVVVVILMVVILMLVFKGFCVVTLKTGLREVVLKFLVRFEVGSLTCDFCLVAGN
jgi:hypothetical protein